MTPCNPFPVATHDAERPDKENQEMELKLNELRDLITPTRTHSIVLGEKYLIRTVTLHYTGRVKAITDSDIVLEDAAWIADTGRFSTALTTGVLDEVEPFEHDAIVSRGCIVDMTIWPHELPRVQK